MLLLRPSCRNSNTFVAPNFVLFIVLHMRQFKTNPGSPQFTFTLQEEKADPGSTRVELTSRGWVTLNRVESGLVAFTQQNLTRVEPGLNFVV